MGGRYVGQSISMPKPTKTYFKLKYPSPDEVCFPIYYYRRRDGTIFACGAKEARAVHRQYEQVGISDGKVYMKLLTEAIQHQDDELSVAEEEKEAGMEEAMTREERREVLLTYAKERRRIADDARAALAAAQAADIEEAKKHKETPPDTSGTVVGQGNAKVNMMIRGFIEKV